MRGLLLDLDIACVWNRTPAVRTVIIYMLYKCSFIAAELNFNGNCFLRYLLLVMIRVFDKYVVFSALFNVALNSIRIVSHWQCHPIVIPQTLVTALQKSIYSFASPAPSRKTFYVTRLCNHAPKQRDQHHRAAHRDNGNANFDKSHRVCGFTYTSSDFHVCVFVLWLCYVDPMLLLLLLSALNLDNVCVPDFRALRGLGAAEMLVNSLRELWPALTITVRMIRPYTCIVCIYRNVYAFRSSQKQPSHIYRMRCAPSIQVAIRFHHRESVLVPMFD